MKLDERSYVVKMKDKKKMIGAGILIGLGTAVMAGKKKLSKTLLKLALGRETPKNIENSKKKASGSETHLKVLEEKKPLAEKLENSGCEEVEIKAYDGIRLVGHYRYCDDPKRIIIAMHGWRSSWCRDYGGIADFWNDNNCEVLYAEQRGQNASEGEYIGFGVMERYDCQKWAEYVDSRTQGELPIYLVGVSMGAATVLMASNLELPLSVHGIMADCGYTSPKAIWKHVVQDNFHIPYSFVASDIDRAYKKIANEDSDYSCEEALKECKIPVLFVHGSDDTFVPVEMTYDNYKACASEKELLIVPGAEHGMSYFVAQELYEQRTKAFWNKHDKNSL